MPHSIITRITSKGTVYRLGRASNVVLNELQAKLIKKKLTVQAFNKDNLKRGSFTSFPKKSYLNSF